MNNIPSELANSPGQDLNFPNGDVDAKVKQFLDEEQKKLDQVATGTPEVPRTEIRANSDFEQVAPFDQVVTEALVETKNYPITEEDKVKYFKAMLADQAVELPIHLFNKQFTVELRSRYSFEQARVWDILELDRSQGRIAKDDINRLATYMQYYCAALMVQRINGALFSDIVLKPGKSLEEDAEVLRKFVDEKLVTLSGIRWTNILNAMRIFETKCARMATEAVNEDFWKPQG
jgi:hypothetical protein